MQVRFWGTRGSLPKPGPTTLRHGGNTSCVEVRAPDGTLIVLDCGTGAHELGRTLVATGERVRGHLFISHMHWDHINGFPFFAPLFVPGNEWDVYAPSGLGERLEDTLAGQMEYPYFPITLEQLAATIRYHDLAEGELALGDVRVVTQYLNHPALTLGYRFEVGGVSVVYATDHEPNSPHQLWPPGEPLTRGRSRVHREDERHIAFIEGADLLIHDAQYALAEYPEKTTWGHTPAELATDFALAADVKRLALFHHDPSRNDDAVDALVAACRQRIAARGGEMRVFAAAEGDTIVLEPLGATDTATLRGARDPAERRASDPHATTIVVVDDEASILEMLIATLEPEGFRLVGARDGETALEIVRAERPDLVLLDWGLPGRDGLDVCRTLRRDPDPKLASVPIVVLTGRTGAEDMQEGFRAGVTDYLTKPFKATHVRSRVRAWLLRAQAREGA